MRMAVVMVVVLLRLCPKECCFVFFFNDTATTEIYTLSLHDALPIFSMCRKPIVVGAKLIRCSVSTCNSGRVKLVFCRSEEHTSELQSQSNLVCRLLLEQTTSD